MIQVSVNNSARPKKVFVNGMMVSSFLYNLVKMGIPLDMNAKTESDSDTQTQKE